MGKIGKFVFKDTKKNRELVAGYDSRNSTEDNIIDSAVGGVKLEMTPTIKNEETGEIIQEGVPTGNFQADIYFKNPNSKDKEGNPVISLPKDLSDFIVEVSGEGNHSMGMNYQKNKFNL